MKLHAFALPLLVAAGVSDPPAPPPLRGSLETLDGLPVLRLSGTPAERGFAHGWLLAKEIVAGIDDGLSTLLGGRITETVNAMLPIVTSAFSFSPEETAELEGMLEGIRARIPAAERRIESLGREIGLAELKAANTFGDWYALSCSSAAVWGSLSPDGKAAVARNFDFPPVGLIVEGQHLRVVAPAAEGERGWVGIGHPGSIGVMSAMNEDGVFVSIHDVHVAPGLKDWVQGNVPRLLAVRRLLERLPARGAVERAAELCRSWGTIYGNNFFVATPERGDGLPAGVLEYDTREDIERGVTLRGPDAGNSWVLCSNHHRLRGRGSCDRYDRLAAFCRKAKKPLDRDGLLALADEAAVPDAGARIRGGVATLHQVIALTGEKTLWIRLLGKNGNIREATAIRVGVPSLLAGPASAAR